MTMNKNLLPKNFTRLGAIAWLAACASGCVAPRAHEQRLVAKPGMTFSEAAVFQYNSSRLMSQQATGLAGAGGPQNSGCTSCR